MSGHSKWHNIKYKKSVEDAKRSKIFSKLARNITMAAREGPDPETNTKLKNAIEQAKSFNMPSDNIERAIKKATGELEGSNLEGFLFEAYGPGNTAILIEGITDNIKRALTEIKKVLSENNAKMAQEGSVRWMFKQKGVISVPKEQEKEEYKNQENIELEAIELGAEDIKSEENFLLIYSNPEKLMPLKKALEEKGIKIESASLEWIPENEITISEKEKDSLVKLLEQLDDLDDVQNVYPNAKI